MRILMSAGGTAGHVYPASTVAAELLADGHDVCLVGTPGGLEARIIPEAGIRFVPLPARGFDRSRPLSLIAALAVLLVSLVRAVRLLGRERPDVVACFGAYVSLPVGLAAVVRRVPLVLHEQNSVPGLATKVLSRWARSVGVTYPRSASYLRRPERAVVTGDPVRAAVLSADRGRGRAALGCGVADVLLLVFGGSQGARHINETTVDLYAKLMEIERVRVVHIAGSRELESVQHRLDAVSGGRPERYTVLGYVDDMGSALAAADIVVARAGATSIAEIAALGRPAILVPYPYATDDHQTRNASAVVEAGGAVLVEDSALGSPAYHDAIARLAGDPALRASMADAARSAGVREATERVAELILSAARP